MKGFLLVLGAGLGRYMNYFLMLLGEKTPAVHIRGCSLLGMVGWLVGRSIGCMVGRFDWVGCLVELPR